jgi:biotin carboxyl carrier protein
VSKTRKMIKSATAARSREVQSAAVNGLVATAEAAALAARLASSELSALSNQVAELTVAWDKAKSDAASQMERLKSEMGGKIVAARSAYDAEVGDEGMLTRQLADLETRLSKVRGALGALSTSPVQTRLD